MPTNDLEELANSLSEFERRYNRLMQNEAGLSPEGQGISIALLTTLHMKSISQAARILRSRTSA